MLSRAHSERLFLRFFGERYRQPLRSCDREDLLTVRKVIPQQEASSVAKVRRTQLWIAEHGFGMLIFVDRA